MDDYDYIARYSGPSERRAHLSRFLRLREPYIDGRINPPGSVELSDEEIADLFRWTARVARTPQFGFAVDNLRYGLCNGDRKYLADAEVAATMFALCQMVSRATAEIAEARRAHNIGLRLIRAGILQHDELALAWSMQVDFERSESSRGALRPNQPGRPPVSFTVGRDGPSVAVDAGALLLPGPGPTPEDRPGLIETVRIQWKLWRLGRELKGLEQHPEDVSAFFERARVQMERKRAAKRARNLARIQNGQPPAPTVGQVDPASNE